MIVWCLSIYCTFTISNKQSGVTYYRQVAQLWQRDRAKLETFSINVHRYSLNHAQNCILVPPYVSKYVRIFLRRKKTMCHNAPWLSALDKQMRLQFAPKTSKADVVSEFWR